MKSLLPHSPGEHLGKTSGQGYEYMMWRPLNNLVKTLQTYHLLSPDRGVREEVNQWLSGRPCLSSHEWYMTHWSPPRVPKPFPQALTDFVYSRLQAYSGLTVGRIHPNDRLVDDLKFPAVCWFDWGLTLCEDFHATFGADISDTFDETQFVTCGDLMYFLKQKLEAHGKKKT